MLFFKILNSNMILGGVVGFVLYTAAPAAYGVPRAGVESELQLPAYTAATATPAP